VVLLIAGPILVPPRRRVVVVPLLSLSIAWSLTSILSGVSFAIHQFIAGPVIMLIAPGASITPGLLLGPA
jgi:hypothetical protein